MLSGTDNPIVHNHGAMDQARRKYWKLFKPKYLLTFRLCDRKPGINILHPNFNFLECLKNVYEDDSKHCEKEDGSVMVCFTMCKSCATLNCRATDVISPPKPKN